MESCMMNSKTDIIIFGGQSNMAGQSGSLIPNECIDGCFEYRYLTDSIIPLKNPNGEYIFTDGTEGTPWTGDGIADEEGFLRWHGTIALGGASDGCTNLIPAFCRAYREACGHDVLAVPVAKGATHVRDWLSGTKCNEILIKKAKCAIAKCDNAGNILFVWFQGENDQVNSTPPERYEQTLIELKNSLKAELGIRRFGIIRVGRFANDIRDEAIMNAQENVCAKDGDFAMLTRIAASLCEKSECMNPDAAGHFNAQALECIGEQAGSRFAQIISERN